MMTVKHRLSRTHPLYSTWSGMRQRCNNPKSHAYKWYGALGVRVCERWSDFAAFVEDMGEKPPGTTLDRYPNPAGNYEPGNCRWATPKEQASNYRLGLPYNKAKTQCKRGHPFTPENTIIDADGLGRKCRLCVSIMNHKHYERNKGQKVAPERKRGDHWPAFHRNGLPNARS